MEKVILARYGEIYLKGNNRGYFERILLENIISSLNDMAKCKRIGGRYLIYDFDVNDENEIISKLQKIFGLTSVSPAVEIDTSVESINEYCATLKLQGTFKVDTKRADKSFPIKSSDYSAQVGGIILKNNDGLKVDLFEPTTLVNIDIRENGKTYIFFKRYDCVGGMPVSTAGNGMLLLSGGIDSPVAGYMMAKRGLSINAIYFHSYPYTSEQAKQKVVDLATIISEYTGSINLFVVPLTRIQETINEKCKPEFMITIMRRFMLRIAEKVAVNNDCSCLITGENLAQVASQTVQGITTSNNVLTTIPMFRPLIAFDKVEIIDIARRIGTYEISNLPYEDCCTVFVPKNPVIKPTVKECEVEESKILNIDELISEAIEGIEIISISPKSYVD